MEKTLMLCYDRHFLPKKLAEEIGYKGDAIFPNHFNPFDTELMEECLEIALTDVTKLNLIVTGMSTAFQMVIDYCNRNGIQLVCLHYDVVEKTYHKMPMSEKKEPYS